MLPTLFAPAERLEGSELRDSVDRVLHHPLLNTLRETTRIFQRYFRTRPGAGRGLGTASVHFLTEEYLGGRVRFRSNPDTGTEFVIQLPLDGAPGREESHPGH